MPQPYLTTEAVSPHRTRDRWLIAVATALGVCLLVLALAAEYIARHAGPLLRSSVVATLSSRFNSPVELDTFDISVARGLQVHGHGLRIFYLAGPTQPDLAQQQGLPAPPMLNVNDFTFRTTFHDLLHLRANLARVDVDGLELHVPPHSGARILRPHPPRSRIALTVAKIYCKNVKLVVETSVPGKAPLLFNIHHLELTDVGPDQPLLYVADVLNPKPTGDVHATGHFGPWQGDDPRSTPLDGDYTFDHVDLSTIKGLRGTLSSRGQFTGRLGHLTVDGTSDTPDFALDVSSHPLAHTTRFHAYVDGTTGDTTLDPVEATFGHSSFTCSGAILRVPGHGNDIALRINMPRGRIEDLLQLTMKVPPVMRGSMNLQAKLHIPPGDIRIARKLQLAGNFRMQHVDFTSTKLQDRIDGLSLRAQGKPQDLKLVSRDGTPQVDSEMAVTFSLANSLLLVRSLAYQVPGAHVNLLGLYPIDGSDFDFRGHVRTDATASQMVTGWKSVLLKPFDGMLKKDGAGAVIPIQITGSRGDFNIGFAMHGANDTLEKIEADHSLARMPATKDR